MIKPVLLVLGASLPLDLRVAFAILRVDEEAVLTLSTFASLIFLTIQAKIRAFLAFALRIREVPQVTLITFAFGLALQTIGQGLRTRFALIV